MKVILDTNIWISFLLGKRLNVLREIFSMEKVEIFVSDQLLSEIRDVVSRPKFIGKIGLDTVLKLFELISAKCKFINDYPDIETAIRDTKDLYLLSMAENIPADYLVTGDNDLLVLRNYKETRIITFAEFINIVSPGEQQ
ncbi:MAG: putative toxin-antitoxin system toxin component, PIN family [Bacteroidales bacterium]|nr:putative toxin-antitoxin system toxin component, PIN family [Bacteroidales bacterium]